jgi:hypothetical protein
MVTKKYNKTINHLLKSVSQHSFILTSGRVRVKSLCENAMRHEKKLSQSIFYSKIKRHTMDDGGFGTYSRRSAQLSSERITFINASTISFFSPHLTYEMLNKFIYDELNDTNKKMSHLQHH